MAQSVLAAVSNATACSTYAHALQHLWRRCSADRRNCGPSPEHWSIWRAELRAERNAPDLALLDEGDPPFRRAVAEMGDVDVVAGRRNRAERHCPQRPKSGQHRPIE